MSSPVTMRSWTTVASLLFLLCGLVLSTAAPEGVHADSAKAVLRKLNAGSAIHSRSELLEARAPKKGGGLGGFGDDDEDDEDDDDDTFEFTDDDIEDDSEMCYESSCSACWGDGYIECPGSSTWCYNPDQSSADVACPSGSDGIDIDLPGGAATALLSTQSSLLGLILGSVGLTAMLL